MNEFGLVIIQLKVDQFQAIESEYRLTNRYLTLSHMMSADSTAVNLS